MQCEQVFAKAVGNVTIKIYGFEVKKNRYLHLSFSNGVCIKIFMPPVPWTYSTGICKENTRFTVTLKKTIK